jgi:hypothetical protein
MAACLDARFHMLPTDGPSTEMVLLDFQAVADPSQHRVKKPQGNERIFYDMPQGEACYFEESDEVYVRFREGVRARSKPGSGYVAVSAVETDPRNLFVASHLVLTIIGVEILKRRGWYNLHAAGFSENGRAILIPGTSGAGKSTLSIALLRAKFDYLTDDMVFLGRGPQGLAARGLVEDVDVSDQTIRFFPELDFMLDSPKTDGFSKKQVRAETVYGTKTVAEADPKVIILPRISGKPTSTLTPIRSDEALLEIVPNLLLTEQRACQDHLGVFADLVKQTSCYRLETGQDFDRIPTLFRELLGSREEVRALGRTAREPSP